MWHPEGAGIKGNGLERRRMASPRLEESTSCGERRKYLLIRKRAPLNATLRVKLTEPKSSQIPFLLRYSIFQIET
jgi:hypothetical protein